MVNPRTIQKCVGRLRGIRDLAGDATTPEISDYIHTIIAEHIQNAKTGVLRVEHYAS